MTTTMIDVPGLTAKSEDAGTARPPAALRLIAGMCLTRGSVAGGPEEIGVEVPARHVLLQRLETNEAATFEILDSEIVSAISCKQLLDALRHRPLRVIARQLGFDLGKIHAVTARIRATPVSIGDLALRHNPLDMLGYVAHLIILARASDIISNIMDQFARRFERGKKGAARAVSTQVWSYPACSR